MKKITFRFVFLYFLLNATSVMEWFSSIPGISWLSNFYFKGDEWVVRLFNQYFFHVKETLNTEGFGSGDTSFAWAQFFTYLVLSFIGCIVWTILDRKREHYTALSFGLKNFLRYYVSMVSFSYGTIKLFALQMPFPNLSQLATPLGDYLPMRLSWMFIGYSSPYQIFSGIAEVIVAILLLNRKTTTLGALMGLAVFVNVAMLNLSYDIPVKLYSLYLVTCCLYLAASDIQRIANFLILNKSVEPSTDLDFQLTRRWQKIGRVIFKAGFVFLFAILPFIESWNRYKEVKGTSDVAPIKSGVYNIQRFIQNNDTLFISTSNLTMWKDFIFDKGGAGSVNSTDSLFRQRYRRGYFTYQPDTATHTIAFKKFATDSLPLFKLNFQIPTDSTVHLWGKVRQDSLRIELVRSKGHFQLAERQFHWISESNR